MFPLKDNIPTDRAPVLTITIIVLNVLAYFLFQHGGISLGDPGGADYVCNVNEWGAVPREFTDPDFSHGACPGNDEPSRWLTLFTSMFMHGGLLHLGGNMLFLWIFGNNIEDGLGRVKFVVFYLLGGLAALAAQIAFSPDSDVPTIGASGAVAAVIGAYILLHPRARVVTLIFIVFFATIIELPALAVLGLWFIQQIVFASAELGSGGQGGVAYWAHIGGFVFGLATIRLWLGRRERERPPF